MDTAAKPPMSCPPPASALWMGRFRNGCLILSAAYPPNDGVSTPQDHAADNQCLHAPATRPEASVNSGVQSHAPEVDITDLICRARTHFGRIDPPPELCRPCCPTRPLVEHHPHKSTSTRGNHCPSCVQLSASIGQPYSSRPPALLSASNHTRTAKRPASAGMTSVERRHSTAVHSPTTGAPR